MKKLNHKPEYGNVKFSDLKHSNEIAERDEGLVWKNFQEGDNQSLIYLYSKYVEKLFLYGQQFCDSKDFVQDCIQELFYELIDRRKSLSQAKSVKAYLFISLKRKILRELKKSNKEEVADAFTFSFLEPAISISKNLKEEDYKLIYNKTNELPTSQREVIFLYFYEGLSYSEIADIMNIKTATARTLTYRALENLEKKIGPHLTSFYLLILINKLDLF
ncbi:MAG: RNA polymerase sigma factor (sigma-70 family) [Parvicella sp.]